MFSKVFALGLGALALVRAAPAFSFQTPMLSCSANFDTSVAALKSNAIEEGFYILHNEAWSDMEDNESQLRGYAFNEPIYVSYYNGKPGPFGVWHVKPSGIPGSNEYKIINHGLGGATDVSRGQIITGHGESGKNFAIEPAGDGLFTIKVPNEDLVWTVNTLDMNLPRSDVYLRPQTGARQAKWKLDRKIKLT